MNSNSTLTSSKILLIGAGKMGGALLAAWLHAGIKPSNMTVLEKETAKAYKLSVSGVKIIHSLNDITMHPDCILLAVKPQSMDALLPELAASSRRRPGSHASPLYLSIAAGKTLGYFEKHLGNAPVVRAMPNTPALIRKGITALVSNKTVSSMQKELATALMNAAGETIWIEDESQMDAVTALSGSGPAYVFLFLEGLIEAGIAQGLHQAMATKLALATVRGSTKLAIKSRESLTELRKNVTSPGGTTEAALAVLMKNDAMKLLLSEGVKAAVKRSKELS